MAKVREPGYLNFSIKFKVITKPSEPFTPFRVY
jgi:hypothetical protein